ncbi:MAG: dihydroxyacetone kinase subunit DhaL [Actinomycetota bacterium]|nr:dihydroxyacetone kinase subunit DhaL [Actinomycetota bacterium]
MVELERHGSRPDAVDGSFVRSWLDEFAEEVARRRDELTQLDAAIGDADHGVNLDAGLRAVTSRLASEGETALGSDEKTPVAVGSPSADPSDSPVTDAPSVTSPSVGSLLQMVGMTLLSTVGGAAGPLYGSLFLKMAGALDSDSAVTAWEWSQALRVGVGSVSARGRAVAGDKTMLDALLPAVDTLQQMLEKGESLASALVAASGAAHDGMLATVPMVARKGRASYLGERSAGHQDPGATSAHMLVAAAARAAGGDAAAT